jgi:hypothetical protein
MYNMFWLTSSEKSIRVRDCSHFILCVFPILVIIWINILGQFSKCKIDL